MQIRLDPDIAIIVRRESEAHERLFKRRKPYTAIVNALLRQWRKDNRVRIRDVLANS